MAGITTQLQLSMRAGAVLLPLGAFAGPVIGQPNPGPAAVRPGI
jgi:hypothetical protein